MLPVAQTLLERWEVQCLEVAKEYTRTGHHAPMGNLQSAWLCLQKTIKECSTDEEALDQIVLWHSAFLPYGDLPHIIDCIPLDLKETPQHELLTAIRDFNEAQPRDVEDWIELRLSFMGISCRQNAITHFMARNYEYMCARNGGVSDEQLEQLYLEMDHLLDDVTFGSCFLRSLKQFNWSRHLLRTNQTQAFGMYDMAAYLLHSWFVSNKSLLGPDDFRVRALATQVYKAWTVAQILFDDEILFNDEHEAQLRITQLIPSIESQFNVAAK